MHYVDIYGCFERRLHTLKVPACSLLSKEQLGLSNEVLNKGNSTTHVVKRVSKMQLFFGPQISSTSYSFAAL